MSERTKLVIEAKNFSLLPETEFFNTIGQNRTFSTNKNGDPKATVKMYFYLWCNGVSTLWVNDATTLKSTRPMPVTRMAKMAKKSRIINTKVPILPNILSISSPITTLLHIANLFLLTAISAA